MRIAVTGGRAHDPTEDEMADFAIFLELNGVTEVNHGDCLGQDGKEGVDRFVARWCRERGIPVRPHPVDHRIDGPWPAAGPRRNGRMLRSRDESGRPIEALARFTGNRGTADCARQADEIGIPVRRIRG